MPQTLGATVDGTSRSIFDAYLLDNNSEKGHHSTLLAGLKPLETLSWRDVFRVTDAVATHLAVPRHAKRTLEFTTAVSSVLHCCAPAGTYLGSSPGVLWKAIQKMHITCWSRSGDETPAKLDAPFILPSKASAGKRKRKHRGPAKALVSAAPASAPLASPAPPCTIFNHNSLCQSLLPVAPGCFSGGWFIAMLKHEYIKPCAKSAFSQLSHNVIEQVVGFLPLYAGQILEGMAQCRLVADINIPAMLSIF